MSLMCLLFSLHTRWLWNIFLPLFKMFYFRHIFCVHFLCKDSWVFFSVMSVILDIQSADRQTLFFNILTPHKETIMEDYLVSFLNAVHLHFWRQKVAQRSCLNVSWYLFSLLSEILLSETKLVSWVICVFLKPLQWGFYGYILKRGTTRNDLQRTRNDLKWPTMSKERLETTHNEQETTYNDLNLPTTSK